MPHSCQSPNDLTFAGVNDDTLVLDSPEIDPPAHYWKNSSSAMSR